MNSDPATFFKAFIISQFTPEVRTAIANMEFDNLVDMGVAADKALEAAKAKPAVNAIATEIIEDWDEDQPAEVNAVGRGYSRGRGGPGRGASRGGQGQKTGGKGKTCFFHDRHGLAAFKCDGAPCPFASAPLAKAGNSTAGR